MTPTECAYVGGIIDGEGCIEFKWANRIRKDRKGTPTYRTLLYDWKYRRSTSD